MSILFRNSKGWLLDQCSYVNEGYQHCLVRGETEQKQYLKYFFKKQYFDIAKPHIILKPDAILDSVTACSSRLVENKTNEVVSKLQSDDKQSRKSTDKKKRKRKHKELNQGEIDSQVHHEKVRRIILEGTALIVAEGHSCGFLCPAENDGKLPIPIEDGRLADLCDMAKQLPLVDDSLQKPVQVIDGDDECPMEQLDLFTRVTENPVHHAREVSLMGERYLLPPHCSFLLSDITRMQPLVNYGKTFEAIVLDPPWENKSVKRSNRYSFLPSSQLRQLPVSLLSAPGCVVATWVTNRQKHLRFVREELYPHWGVEVLAEWIWVKVTRSGEFVFPLDSPHKKPYEMLVLGRFRGDMEQKSSSSEASEPVLPDHRLIVSVPSLLHSHKPSIAEVLKEYLGPDAACLELFARNLQPGWTSWGNEVIKFQRLSYFHVEPASGPSPPLAQPALARTL
ncbi:hypothetical protein SKAU_G00072840 [Synaphobranchus kaupii]|uniref:Methyltransferase-like protein 4 n=1 Tax=Synaphobranchus kaupii TaxID=118154 RepID=A0A9Q1G889_SYNKA|nr:hypothetical protein SKAU_G00072840 [Synaphobranchus kaupii]